MHSSKGFLSFLIAWQWHFFYCLMTIFNYTRKIFGGGGGGGGGKWRGGGVLLSNH